MKEITLIKQVNGKWISGWEPELFGLTPISGRDSVTSRPWPVSWICDGKTRHLVVPEDWRFGIAVDKIPGFWMRVLRSIINPLHMQRSSCVHDLLYATKGGTRTEETCTLQPIVLPFNDVSRDEADSLAYALAMADGIATWEAKQVYWVLSTFAQGVWDE